MFWPRLSVEALEPLDPSSAFSVPFVITNEGNLALYDLRLGCVADVVGTEVTVQNSGIKEIVTRPRLAPDDVMTEWCALDEIFFTPEQPLKPRT